MLKPEEELEMRPLRLKDRVVKTTGDYTFDGLVVGSFWKRDGISRRYVVEDDRGVTIILNREELTLVDPQSTEPGPVQVIDGNGHPITRFP